jgi:YVTN family beta-propeller protein
VHFIEAATGKMLDSLLVGARPRDAKFTPDGSRLWVTSESRASVAVFDPATRKILSTIDLRKADPPPGVQAVSMAMTRAADRLYVAAGRGNHAAEIDMKAMKVTRWFPTGERTWGIALSPDETRLYGASGLSGDLAVIDLKSGKRVKVLKLGGRPWGVVTTP